MQRRNDMERYGRVSIALHWAGAVSILAMLASAWWIWVAPDDDAAGARMELHGSIGILLYLVIAARIIWHFVETQPRKLGASPRLNALATAVHATMLVLIAVQLVTGPVDVWSGGWPVSAFGWFFIPSPFGAGQLPWHDMIGDVHRYTGYVLAALVGLHLAAVVKHGIVDRDGTLQRMLGLKVPQRDAADPVAAREAEPDAS